MPLLIRLVAGLIAVSISFLTGWFAVVHVKDVMKVMRESTRVTGWLTKWETEGGLRAEVELGTPESPNRIWVPMNNEYNVRLFRDVDVYLHPSDPSRSRLGGFFQFWASPLVLGLVSVLFLVPAVWLLAVSGPAHYSGSVPEEWAGRWVWFSTAPWAAPADDSVLRFPSYYWRGGALLALFVLALLGAPVAYDAIVHRNALWHGRLLLGTFAFLVTAAFTAVTFHCLSYRLSFDDGGVREQSVFGWREVPWPSITRIEDESVRWKRWEKSWRRWSPGLTDPHLRSLVLLNGRGEKMLSIGILLEPPPARRRLTSLLLQKTGLTPVETERQVAR